MHDGGLGHRLASCSAGKGEMFKGVGSADQWMSMCERNGRERRTEGSSEMGFLS